MSIGVTLLIGGTFASYSLPISIDSTRGLCPQRGKVSTRRLVKFTKPKVIAPACYFGLFIIPDKQEKERIAILAEVINADNHKKVRILLII